MAKTSIAGIVYFLIVFMLGFGLGAIRVFLVAPHLGETVAVLLETPLMLSASWVVCGWLVCRFNVASRTSAGALMGVVALGLMMTAEFAVSLLLFGRSPTQFVANFRTIPGTIGLVAQLAFGLMPLLRINVVSSDQPLPR
jgi:hypothetical protein